MLLKITCTMWYGFLFLSHCHSIYYFLHEMETLERIVLWFNRLVTSLLYNVVAFWFRSEGGSSDLTLSIMVQNGICSSWLYAKEWISQRFFSSFIRIDAVIVTSWEPAAWPCFLVLSLEKAQASRHCQKCSEFPRTIKIFFKVIQCFAKYNASSNPKKIDWRIK